MLNDFTGNPVVGLWFAAAALLTASVMGLGVNLGVSTTALLLTLSLAPPEKARLANRAGFRP